MIEILLLGACSEFCNYDRRLLIIVYRSWVEITLTPHASTKYREILGRYFLDQICPNKLRYASLYRPSAPYLSCFHVLSILCGIPLVIAEQVSYPITIRRCFASTRNSAGRKLAQKFLRSPVTRRNNTRMVLFAARESSLMHC